MAICRALAGALFLFAAIVSPALADQPASSHSVQVRGSTIFLPAMQMLAERYMAEHQGSRIVVLGGGSWLGLKSVLDKSAALGMVSGEGFPDDLAELAEDENLSLRRIPITRYAVVPIVHPGNAVANLSLAQLRDIYSGRIANWKEVGGANQPIHVIASEDAMAGIFQVWTAKVMGGITPVTPAARTVAATQISDMVAHDPLAIGYNALGRLTGTAVKPLKVGGAEAREETIADGRYGITGDMALAYLEPLSGPTKAFLDYCLGEAGREEARRIHGVFIGDRK
jgi:phosphate transport system substrate-binding protein